MDLAAGEDILNGNRVADGTSDAQKRRIAYYYDRIKKLHIVNQQQRLETTTMENITVGKCVEAVYFHVQPHRVRIVHHLLVAYDICKEMEMFVGFEEWTLKQKPTLIDYKDIMRFHSDDYVNFLRVINPDNASSMIKQQIQCISTQTE